MNPPEAVASQNAGKQAEVWSYAPAMQQSASNNFVRAIDKLAKAKSEFERYIALGNAAKSDFVFGNFEDARSYARQLLALDESFKSEPSRDGQAVYDGNLVLGRLAVQEDRLDEAKQYSSESGTSTGSAVLGTFGPNMSLARDLLESGERDAVLEFFEQCRKFWTSGNQKLTLWSEDVKAGRMPDFGANLFY
jgi:tetratricopeptide (TPR) repeat protein